MPRTPREPTNSSSPFRWAEVATAAPSGRGRCAASRVRHVDDLLRLGHLYVVLAEESDANVPGAGTLRIVRAPEGAAVATSAQRNGELEFIGSRGVRGTLHLSDDSVTIERRGRADSRLPSPRRRSR